MPRWVAAERPGHLAISAGALGKNPSGCGESVAQSIVCGPMASASTPGLRSTDAKETPQCRWHSSLGWICHPESLHPWSSQWRSIRSSQGATQPPLDSRKPMRTVGKRAHTPLHMTRTATSIISTVSYSDSRVSRKTHRLSLLSWENSKGIVKRSYGVPGSWHLRMVYPAVLSCYDP